MHTCTIPVYFHWPYSECPTPYSRVSYSECPTPYSWMSYSECPTPYKCALFRIDTIESPAVYKNLTSVGARQTLCFGKIWKMAGGWDTPLVLQDLAKDIFMYAKIWFLWQASQFIRLTRASQMFFFSMFGWHYQLVTMLWTDIAVECAFHNGIKNYL